MFVTDSEMMKNEISLSDIRISTDKNPWKFSNFSYRKFFKFYKFHFPWMQFFTCTITILYTAEKQLFEIHNDVVPFLLFYSKTCCMCQIVLFYSTFGWKRQNHFFLFSFSKHKFLSNLTWTPLVFVNSIKKVLTPVDNFTMLLFLPKHLSLYEWSP